MFALFVGTKEKTEYLGCSATPEEEWVIEDWFRNYKEFQLINTIDYNIYQYPRADRYVVLYKLGLREWEMLHSNRNAEKADWIELTAPYMSGLIEEFAA